MGAKQARGSGLEMLSPRCTKEAHFTPESWIHRLLKPGDVSLVLIRLMGILSGRSGESELTIFANLRKLRVVCHPEGSSLHSGMVSGELLMHPR
jgi:hypothetical protein